MPSTNRNSLKISQLTVHMLSEIAKMVVSDNFDAKKLEFGAQESSQEESVEDEDAEIRNFSFK